jgi:hypothetical protein
MQLSERPGMCFAIRAHLFPRRLRSLKIRRSSWAEIGPLLIFGSRWLCHLQKITHETISLPLPALLSTSVRCWHSLLQSLGHQSPLLGAQLVDQRHNAVVLLRKIRQRVLTYIFAPEHAGRSFLLEALSSRLELASTTRAIGIAVVV